MHNLFRRGTRLCIYLLACLLLAACENELRVREYSLAPDTPNPSQPSDEFYVIGTGDVLGIVVWKEPTLTGSAKVRPDGVITLPLVNEVQVAGLTTGQLRELLERQYQEYIASPFVSVRVEAVTSSEIFLIGRVLKPAPYPALGNDTVFQLISRAGGLTMFANPRNIRVVRRENNKVTEYTVDYDAILRADLKQDILLKPGDRVIVP
jgi:polysaccharide biosynthesis/export protein